MFLAVKKNKISNGKVLNGISAENNFSSIPVIGDQNRTAESAKLVQLVDKFEIVVIEQRDKEPWLYSFQ